MLLGEAALLEPGRVAPRVSTLTKPSHWVTNAGQLARGLAQDAALGLVPSLNPISTMSRWEECPGRTLSHNTWAASLPIGLCLFCSKQSSVCD